MDHALQVRSLKELMQQLDDGRNVDAGVQYRMPISAYVCPEQAQREREAFFQNHPQLIGLSGDLPEPGSFMTMNDFGTPILATRDKAGVFRAFLNACRHRSMRCPPQSGQRVMSISNTRFNRCAQVSGAVGGSLQSLRESVGAHCRVAGAAAESEDSPEALLASWELAECMERAIRALPELQRATLRLREHEGW